MRDSVDALKRFQKDQKLTSDGKISSLALIGLGLGPKHEPIGDYAAKPAANRPLIHEVRALANQ